MRFWLRTATLALLLFVLQAVDFGGFTLNGSALATPGWALLASLVTAAALGWAAVRSHWHGWRLVLAVFLAHYGIATLMTAVEAVYLPDLRALLPTLLVNGAVTAALFAPATIALHGKWHGRRTDVESAARIPRASQLLWRLPVLAVVWMVLFVAAGALVFLPAARLLAPELLQSGYADVPAWVLPFQGARGLLWVGCSLPLLASLGGSRRHRGVVLGTLFAALLGANLIAPNELMPPALRLAHAAEVALANFVFGFVAGVLLTPPASTIEPGDSIG